MKKNTYMIILAVITIACIIIGSLMNLTDMFSFRNDSNEHGESSHDGRESERVVMNDIGQFQSIEADIDIANLTIATGDDYSVEWYYKNDNEPEASVENGVLKMTQKTSRNIMNLQHLAGVHEMDLKITVPAGTELQNINVQSDIAEISLNGLTAKNCSVRTDVGNIKLNGLKIPSLTISCDTGDLDLDSSEFTNLSVNSDIGDIDIHIADDISLYSLDLKTELGEVEVGDQDHGRSYQAAGTGGKSISVRTDTGDIEIN